MEVASSRAGIAFALFALVGGAAPIHAQELAPRAYTITPLGSNAITLSEAYNRGDLLLEGAAPIEDATARPHAPVLTYYRAFSLFGRSANAIAGLGYGVGTFEGSVLGEPTSVRRSSATRRARSSGSEATSRSSRRPGSIPGSARPSHRSEGKAISAQSVEDDSSGC